MGNFKDEDKINELRQRLYARGAKPEKRERPSMQQTHKDVPTSWKTPPKADIQQAPPTAPQAPTATADGFTPPDIAPMAMKKQSRRYRMKILLAGVFFFLFAVIVSSYFFVAGGDNISGENIAVTINGPFTIGGGEVMSLQIGVTNQNVIPIEAATLIVTYPSGTQSATDEGKEIFVERLPLDTIKSGETLNIPLRAIVFGEENEEKNITAVVEYRVKGSNSTFAKEAEPLRFKISSSPVVISVDALHKISSGQETAIELTVSSNAPTVLNDILVKADYPTGFDFSSAEPAPVSGQNVWRISSLAPESDTKIIIKGIVVGRETDEYTMHFSTGVPSERDPNLLASIFSTASTDFLIEQPFIGVELEINGDDSGVVAAEAGENINVDIVVSNSLDDTIYDGRIELSLAGNALSDFTVSAGSGFYDSKKNTVYWDASSIDDLKEIAPGKAVRLGVSLKPDPDVETTPQLAFDVDVRARRVTEGRASEELIGTASGLVKVSSIASLITEVGRGTSIFTETGPLPPVAEEETTYTLTLFTQNGSNDMSDVEVVASLPGYVEWLGKTTGAGTITYNEVARTVTWNAGDIDANQSKIAAFQVSLLPSVTQIGTTPVLLGEQRLRGTDDFTGSVVRTSFREITTRLAEEAGYPAGIGDVQKEEE